MDTMRSAELRALAEQCGFKMNNYKLLNIALTHPTYVFENRGRNLEHNQRLEFLGDAILGLVIGEYLYRHFPARTEGELTKMRAAVVCEATLAKKALELGLGKKLLLGRGEELTGGRERSSILADAFEAILGAVYLEAGLKQVEKFVVGLLNPEIEQVAQGGYSDYKTMLQEIVQKKHDENVNYAIMKEVGPDHDKTFVAGVIFKGEVIAQGIGKSKKEAEQKAAQVALDLFK